MMKKILASGAVMFLGLGVNVSHAQDDIDQLLEAGINDATLLVKGYVNPFMEGFGTGLSNGWYNTAKAHKSFGFDITVTVNAAYVPDKDAFYNVNDLDLQTVELDDSMYPDGNIPTMFGPNGATPTFRELSSRETFEGPTGLGVEEELGFNAVPVPMAQLGIGIVKNTDIKLRWTPEIEVDDSGDGKVKLLGFGVMHDFKQYIPSLEESEVSLSAFVGYTKLTSTIDFTNGDPSQNQTGEFEVNTLTIQGLASKEFSILTLYGGIGFNRVRSNVSIKGEYDINEDGDFDDANERNPLSIDFASGGPRITGGFRIRLVILTLHADYTLQKYNTLTAGVGFTVR